MSTRVAVVDDDEVNRRGLVALLDEQIGIEVTGVLTHHEALAWGEEWHDIDVAIVDACDERQVHDHFPGVAVVARIRTFRTSAETLVIVRTGHFFDDAVRRRMGEARADFFFHRSELQDADALRDAVLHPERIRAGVPDADDPAGLIRLGVGRTTRVNEAVSDASAHGLLGAASNGRRLRTRRREEFNTVARLTPMNADGTLPDRNQSVPSLPQIGRFLEWATRTKPTRG